MRKWSSWRTAVAIWALGVALLRDVPQLLLRLAYVCARGEWQAQGYGAAEGDGVGRGGGGGDDACRGCEGWDLHVLCIPNDLLVPLMHIIYQARGGGRGGGGGDYGGWQ